MARSRGLGSIVTAPRRLDGQLGFIASPRVAIGFCASVLLALVGCAPGNSALIIVNQIAPSDSCEWEAGGASIAAPTLDIDPLTPEIRAGAGLGAGSTYTAFFSVQSYIRSRYSETYPVQADVNALAIQSAEVELLGVDGRRLPGGFYRTRAFGHVPSAVGETPGTGVVNVEVIPASMSLALGDAFAGAGASDGLITASVVIIGMTTGATEVRSMPFILPIRLCYGCLYVDRVTETGEVGSCTPGQDSAAALPGFSSTPTCVDSEDCASGLCTLGHCARDLP